MGIVVAVVLAWLAVTGLLLNHPELLGRPPAARVVAIDPLDARRLFRGGEWLEVSHDAGESWDEVHMLVPAAGVVDIAFAPDRPREVWVAMRDGVVRSSDGGAVWEPVRLDFVPLAEGVEIERLALGPRGAVRLVMDSGQLASTDGGASWTPAPGSPPPAGGLYSFVHRLHTGYLVGSILVRVHDVAAVGFVVLAGTGLVLWRRPKRSRRRRTDAARP